MLLSINAGKAVNGVMCHAVQAYPGPGRREPEKTLSYKPSTNQDHSCGMYAVDYMSKHGMLDEQARRELQEELKTGIPAPKRAPEEPKEEEQKETEGPVVQGTRSQLSVMQRRYNGRRLQEES